MADKQKIIDYIAYRKEGCNAVPTEICPFNVYWKSKGVCMPKCGEIFPKWRKYINRMVMNADWECPCFFLSKDYVIRVFRKWLKGGG